MGDLYPDLYVENSFTFMEAKKIPFTEVQGLLLILRGGA